MLAEYYNPKITHKLKSDMLPMDIQNPQFTFEYAGEFQQSMQRDERV